MSEKQRRETFDRRVGRRIAGEDRTLVEAANDERHEDIDVLPAIARHSMLAMASFIACLMKELRSEISMRVRLLKVESSPHSLHKPSPATTIDGEAVKVCGIPLNLRLATKSLVNLRKNGKNSVSD